MSKRELLEQKLVAVNQSLKEHIPERQRWLQAKLFDELHMQQWLLAILRDRLPSPGTRLLDVGAGYGGFAAAATWYGFQVTALEPNPQLAEIVALRAECFGVSIPVVCGEAEVFRPEVPFEIVTLWNVLEHVQAPADFLKVAREWIGPNGSIYLNVMNRYSILDPHVHLIGVNFLPPPLRELYVRLRQREGSSAAPYEMRLECLHYFTPQRFESLCRHLSLVPHRIRLSAGMRELVRPSFLYRLEKRP